MPPPPGGDLFVVLLLELAVTVSVEYLETAFQFATLQIDDLHSGQVHTHNSSRGRRQGGHSDSGVYAHRMPGERVTAWARGKGVADTESALV
jgi:hypothetical protein